MSPADLPLLLTVEETAEVLRIGRTAAYDAVRRGEIESIRVGRVIRVPRARLLALLGEADPGPRPEVAEAAEA